MALYSSGQFDNDGHASETANYEVNSQTQFDFDGYNFKHFFLRVFSLAMILEAGDHAETSAIGTMTAVVTRRITMAPHNVVDEGSLFLSVELLITLGAAKGDEDTVDVV